ncbi:MAG: phospholipase D/Transphosphatidylase [Gemmatimonadetes bacterium]|nr:phospholipase D/Transphosphatidylase [Gemmatimonadota bacterium]
MPAAVRATGQILAGVRRRQRSHPSPPIPKTGVSERTIPSALPVPAAPAEGERPGSSVAQRRTLVRYAERAMVRATDAAQVRGNTGRLLVDGPAAFESWERSIVQAREWVHLENYILRDDRTGRRFRDLLAERAAAGVKVRVLYDWLGCWATPGAFWRPLRDAGAEVRSFAPPRPADPLNFFRRDHRKVLAVDGEYASVTGMCIGDQWAGDPDAGILPWRDTGVEFRGPVAAVIDRAFARTWAVAGGVMPPDEVPDPARVPRMGDMAVRVVEGEPGRSRIYRLSELVQVGVERRLWITDPYFVLPPAMAESLSAAARDGVDVRVIVPAYNNWPIVGGMSRAGYRPLLEAGVRLFEWEGPMIHAKTAVADGIWSRVGSSNMNLASLLGNWEIDVAVLDRGFATEMEALFLSDMQSSVEITLSRPKGDVPYRERRSTERVVVEVPGEEAKPGRISARERRRRSRRGSNIGRTLGRLARAGSVLSRALAGQRSIGREDRGWVAALAVILLLYGVLGFVEPRLISVPIGVLLVWLAVVSLGRALARPKPGDGGPG